jgi:hypothetical protein
MHLTVRNCNDRVYAGAGEKGAHTVTVTQQSTPATEPSLGELVKEASTQFSTVLHGEIELAKIELKSTFKNAGTGVVFFIAAAVLVVFSLTFGFIALAEGLHALYFSLWLSYTIVFGFIFLLAALSGLLGYRRVRRIKAPERTIATTKQTVQALRHPSTKA